MPLSKMTDTDLVSLVRSFLTQARRFRKLSDADLAREIFRGFGDLADEAARRKLEY